MISSKQFLSALLLTGAALSVQAAEIPLNSAQQPCLEHSSFNSTADNHNMVDQPGRSSNHSTDHCLTSIQSSNSNQLFGNNELFK